MSLSAHLTAGTAEHGRLAFHPDCPRCRAERMAGNLAADSLVSRRGQAALAAGLLAFSAGAAPALAQAPEADQHQEATPGSEPPGLEPDFDPGGDDTFDAELAPVPGGPEAGGHEDEGLGAPVETEPTTDADVLLLLEEVQAPAPPQPTPEPLPAPPPAPPAVPGTPIPPPSEPPAADLEQPARQPEQRQTSSERKAPEGSPQRHEPEPVVTTSPPPQRESPALVAQAVTSPAPPTSALAASASPPTTAPVSQPGGPAGGPISGPSYTVRAGDSLWSIARRLLGPEASAGRIAREVNRLWELNRGRIATGDPDLIHVGTVLKL